MADGADLAQFVGDGEEFGGAGEKLAPEIGSQAIAHDRDVEPVGDAGQLPDLVPGQELRLVDEDAIDLLLPVLARITRGRSSASP